MTSLTLINPMPSLRTTNKIGRARIGIVRDVVGCGLLVALVVAMFMPTVSFDFVNWDDPWYVTNNSLITSWHPANLWVIATKPAIRNYAPLTMFAYLVEHSLWGMWPGGYHLVNLFLHAVNSVLVYVLIKQLVGRRFDAWATAALFAVHPVQIETVAWVSSLKGLLSGAFILGSLICWLRPNRSPRAEGWGLAFHLCGLLSKALGIAVPGIVVVYDVIVQKKRPADAIARQIVPATLAVLVLLVTMSAQTSELGGVRDHLEWSKARIAAVDAVILWKYVAMLVWPHDLSVLYDVRTTRIAGTIALSIVGWIAVAWAAFAARKRYPLFLVGLTAFGGLLFPVLNFFPITTLMNDRYLYLPSIPVFVLFAAGIQSIIDLVQRELRLGSTEYDSERPGERSVVIILARSIAYSATALLILGYAAATHDRLPVWQNDVALWEDTLEKAPALPVVRIQWAWALHNAHHDSQAVAVLERTLVETHPDIADRERIRITLDDWKRTADQVE